MSKIINNTNVTFSPSAQQAILNAAAHTGAEDVFAKNNYTDGDKDTLFDLCDANDNYLFSIDLDGDVICDKR